MLTVEGGGCDAMPELYDVYAACVTTVRRPTSLEMIDRLL